MDEDPDVLGLAVDEPLCDSPEGDDERLNVVVTKLVRELLADARDVSVDDASGDIVELTDGLEERVDVRLDDDEIFEVRDTDGLPESLTEICEDADTVFSVDTDAELRGDDDAEEVSL